MVSDGHLQMIVCPETQRQVGELKDDNYYTNSMGDLEHGSSLSMQLSPSLQECEHSA